MDHPRTLSEALVCTVLVHGNVHGLSVQEG